MLGHRGVSFVWATLWLLLTSACGAAPPRFALREIVWDDDDRAPFSPRPPEFYSPYMWDGADNTFFRPVSEFFLFQPSEEAHNVNAVDEAPDSSWFTNRLSRTDMSPQEVATGACDPANVVPKPWSIVAGKPDGSNPGFFIRDANGRRYLLKPDTETQRERPTAADPIATSILHAAGYFVPCARVVFAQRADLQLADGSEVRRTDGRRFPMTQHIVDEVLRFAEVRENGDIRFVASQFIEGRPISPWRYENTWDADPNDVIAHHHRRELRGLYVLYAWINRIDSRQENTMAAWMTTGDDAPGYVRHYVIDLSETFGILIDWNIAWRFGHSGYFDLEHIGGDFLTLGLDDRPWHHARLGPSGTTFGYFDVERFAPDQWRAGYPNKSFSSKTERDCAWMARILARLGPAHIDAIARLGQFRTEETTADLKQILTGRRGRILERWLTRLSPLARAEAHRLTGERVEVCFEDAAVASGIRSADARRYEAWGHRDGVGEVAAATRAEGHVACASIPSIAPSAPSYGTIDVIASSAGRERTYPVRAHFYVLPDGGVQLVGLERRTSFERTAP